MKYFVFTTRLVLVAVILAMVVVWSDFLDDNYKALFIYIVMIPGLLWWLVAPMFSENGQQLERATKPVGEFSDTKDVG